MGFLVGFFLAQSDFPEPKNNRPRGNFIAFCCVPDKNETQLRAVNVTCPKIPDGHVGTLTSRNTIERTLLIAFPTRRPNSSVLFGMYIVFLLFLDLSSCDKVECVSGTVCLRPSPSVLIHTPRCFSPLSNPWLEAVEPSNPLLISNYFPFFVFHFCYFVCYFYVYLTVTPFRYTVFLKTRHSFL